jgi:uncharacterized damage-inducible protein DinB
MDSTQLANLIRTTGIELELLVAQLSVAQMNQPGAVGTWSVKDVLAHIAFWERYAVNIIRAIKRGETPVLDVEDSTESRNAGVVAQYYLASIGAVMADWQQAHEELIEQVLDLSAADLNEPARFAWSADRTLHQRIAANSYAHQREHIDQIRDWMRRLNEAGS